jgi:hypothetical protein
MAPEMKLRVLRLSRENLEIAAPLKAPLQHVEIIVIVFDVEHFGGRRSPSYLTGSPLTS